MGSYLNVTNIHVDFEGENCIFLNMCTVIVRLKKKKCLHVRCYLPSVGKPFSLILASIIILKDFL